MNEVCKICGMCSHPFGICILIWIGIALGVAIAVTYLVTHLVHIKK